MAHFTGKSGLVSCPIISFLHLFLTCTDCLDRPKVLTSSLIPSHPNSRFWGLLSNWCYINGRIHSFIHSLFLQSPICRRLDTRQCQHIWVDTSCCAAIHSCFTDHPSHYCRLILEVRHSENELSAVLHHHSSQNFLPASVIDSDSLATFKAKLKTCLSTIA